MIKTPHRVAIEGCFSPKARDHFTFVTKQPSLWEKVKPWVAYGVVLAGVATAAFIVTPAHAGGSMAHDVKVIVVSPSVTIMGLGAQGDTARQAEVRLKETLKHRSDMELEQLKSDNARALEADRAYYKKLEFQRKKRGY